MHFLGQVVAWFTTAAHWAGEDGIPHRMWEHVLMALAAVLASCALAIPVGLTMGHTGKGGGLAINVSNLGRAIPSFAIIVLAAQIFGIGAKPAFVALVALAIPPMVTNTYTGIRGVDDDVREAARGMGLTGSQVLRKVELPMGMPLLMAGVRTSAVQVVATATLAALVGWGGLGRYIIDGIARRDFPMVFAGALLVALLSLATEVALGRLQRRLVPRGLQSGLDQLTVLPGAAAPVEAGGEPAAGAFPPSSTDREETHAVQP